MCSELTPRAPVPDNRTPQLMQPWTSIPTPTSLSTSTYHVARHITAEPPTLAPVEPIRIFFSDYLDKLHREKDKVSKIKMIISPSFTFMSCLMCNLSCFTSDKTNRWPTHLSLTERQLLFASFWIGRHRRRVVVEQCHKDPRGARAKTPETHETWDLEILWLITPCLKLWSYLQIPLHQTPQLLSCETSRTCLVSFFLV